MITSLETSVKDDIVDLLLLSILTYIEYRAVSGVFQNIDLLPPLPLGNVSSPRTKGGGVNTRRVVRGVGGQYFGRRQTLDWPLTV
jgi:hypothetical protein